ncbi:hypothetical protein DM02DRAFT_628883 [Periconia macrospinosa]|uniref:Uncharacterized protein n=1 Tax=Periconia macrospinosa TaxID=97972 RepID=A0A2V1DRX7_9PLEO|nr:hypothetical protein DM02DRAFT_628883 [Periconia macrospinosa]
MSSLRSYNFTNPTSCRSLVYRSRVRTVGEILPRFTSAVTTPLSSSVDSVPVVVAERAAETDLTSLVTGNESPDTRSLAAVWNPRSAPLSLPFSCATNIQEQTAMRRTKAKQEWATTAARSALLVSVSAGGMWCLGFLQRSVSDGDSTGDGTGGCGGGGAIVGTIDGAGGAGSSGNAGDDVSNGDGPGDDTDGVASDEAADNIGDGAGDAAADDAGEVQDKVANEGRASYLGLTILEIF